MDHAWKDVLDVIYNKCPGTYGWGTLLNHVDHPLCKEGVIDVHDLEQGVMFLQDHGLIEQDYKTWLITSKGFMTAVQNAKIKNDEKNRNRMLWVTIVIACAAVVELILCVFN